MLLLQLPVCMSRPCLVSRAAKEIGSSLQLSMNLFSSLLGILLPLQVEVLEVGNPLVSWASAGSNSDAEDDSVGLVVLDLGICFQFPGSVHAVRALFADRHEDAAVLEELWPVFLLLEHAEAAGATIWKVTATSEASRGSPHGRPMRLKLSTPLLARPGQCLGWYMPGSIGANRIGFADTASFGQRRTHPDGKDKMHVSAFAKAPYPPNPLREGSRLSFRNFLHRRYALIAEQEPTQNSYYHYVFSHLHRRARQSDSHVPAAQDCWGSGSGHNTCCVPAGTGDPFCFDAVYTYELCCTPSAAGASGWTPTEHSLPPSKLTQLQPNLLDEPRAQPSPRPALSVDLFVRTYHAKMQELMHLLHSVSLFWPADWGVVVVLDGDSLEDEHACTLLPRWVRCILQPRPSFLVDLQTSFRAVDPHGHFGGAQRQHGLVWKEWTECWADNYSRAEFIAICDSDVVLTTFGLPQLMFQPARPGSNHARPVLWGFANLAGFPSTVAALGLRWQAEFMDSFPLVIRRDHFQALRRHIDRLYGKEPGRNSSRGFNIAFARFLTNMQVLSGGAECPCFHSMMGSLLWAHHRAQYVWSIRHGHLSGVPLEHTCPRLRVAQHVPYWGREHWMDYERLPDTRLKVGGDPAVLSEVAYAGRASALILSGLCAVQWMEVKTSRFRSFASFPRRNFTHFWRGSRTSLKAPDAGLRETQRDLCSHGLRLVEGRAEIEERLLTSNFPARRWTSMEALHCGSLQPEKLRSAYRGLMRTIVFALQSRAGKNAHAVPMSVGEDIAVRDDRILFQACPHASCVADCSEEETVVFGRLHTCLSVLIKRFDPAKKNISALPLTLLFECKEQKDSAISMLAFRACMQNVDAIFLELDSDKVDVVAEAESPVLVLLRVMTEMTNWKKMMLGVLNKRCIQAQIWKGDIDAAADVPPPPAPVAEDPGQRAVRRNQRRGIPWGPFMLSPIVPHHGRQTGWGAICNLRWDRGEGASSTQCKNAVSYGTMDDATCILILKRWLCAGLHDDEFPQTNPRTHHVKMGGPGLVSFAEGKNEEEMDIEVAAYLS
ncbi:unnamed protein product [Symbiodinium sp. CCMP2592]|nr:unnamed protein product [Symbiodinium sp. CCMP2592]